MQLQSATKYVWSVSVRFLFFVNRSQEQKLQLLLRWDRKNM